MPNKQIFIVSGTTGSYEDRTTWQVAAFEDADQAQKYCALAQAEAQSVIDRSPEEFYITEPTRYDTQFHAMERFVRYRVTPLLMFVGAFPQNGMFGVDPALLSSKPLAEIPVSGTFADKLKLALQPA